MPKVSSKDGTQIAFDKISAGAPVILVDAALGYRSFSDMPDLARLLAPDFTVYTYDRRGRGESGDSRPLSLEREVEDIDALIKDSGGTAYLYGKSSGGCLALEAAMRLDGKVKKLAVYEAPYNSSDGAEKIWKDYVQQLTELLAAGRRGDAVVLFMTVVGTPAESIAGMRHSPIWPAFEAVAPSLAYDSEVMGVDQSVPVRRAAGVTADTLFMNGGAGAPFMADTARLLARVIARAQYRVLAGQTHDVKLEVLAPVLVDYFQS